MACISGLHFEHYHDSNVLGRHETSPRLSWTFINASSGFRQVHYEIEVRSIGYLSNPTEPTLSTYKVDSSRTTLVSWPHDPLESRQRVSVRVRAWGEDEAVVTVTPWSAPVTYETGLLDRKDWTCRRIAAPWAPADTTAAGPEQLFRRVFEARAGAAMASARLYITAQGVYEAEINGQRVGDQFMAPGWTTYQARLQYQTYDVTELLRANENNCLAVRVAEGWFCGRIGFEGGRRNIWGPHPALLAQLELTFEDGSVQTIETDDTWTVHRGPIREAELYDGERYDATLEIPGWSTAGNLGPEGAAWESAVVLEDLPHSVSLEAGCSEPVRRIEVVEPIALLQSPSGKTILDFGQNVVGYLRIRNISGPRGHKIVLRHAEVLEHDELGTRPLRECRATDEYVLRGPGADNTTEAYEPRFTFHGFRYAEIDGWTQTAGLLLSSVEAVVCHTDMKRIGDFSSSHTLLNKLYHNVMWSLRGNFLSIPTDCPQRDERLGWSGDLAVFAPAATMLYDCYGMLKNWLVDVEHDQRALGGVPAFVTPDSMLTDPAWCRKIPCAVWNDVTVLAPWALYEETGDVAVLRQQYGSMTSYLGVIPRQEGSRLWDPSIFQLADWLDPAAPPDKPWQARTDPQLVANAFLVQSLHLVSRIAGILGHKADQDRYQHDADLTRHAFQNEYMTASGLLCSDSQTAYALAICFDLLPWPAQRDRAGDRLAWLVNKDGFRIGTGFAGTPYVCEALASTGHLAEAYGMLLQDQCPSWLYPVTMGATTVWERWDSMLPDGSINPGKMTSFNHYALGAIVKFAVERVAGLQRLEPGWTRFQVAPCVGAELTRASATHALPTGGVIRCSWKLVRTEDNDISDSNEEKRKMKLDVTVPHGTVCEVVMPEGDSQDGVLVQQVGPGTWSFETVWRKRTTETWPVPPITQKFLSWDQPLSLSVLEGQT